MPLRVPVRASSWSTWMECAYMWEGIYLMGMTKPSSGRAWLGTSLHRASARIDLARMEGTPYERRDAPDVFHSEFANPTEEVDWRFTDAKPTQLEAIGIKLTSEYAQVWSPTYSFTAVEKQISDVDIPVEEHNVIITLSGRMDRARIVGGKAKSILDIKTGKRAVVKGHADVKGHKAQLGVYEIIEERETGEPCGESAEILGMQTSKNPSIASGHVRNAKDMLLGTPEQPGLINMAAKMFKEGLFPPNPRSMLCDQRYCPRWEVCKYHD